MMQPVKTNGDWIESGALQKDIPIKKPLKQIFYESILIGFIAEAVIRNHWDAMPLIPFVEIVSLENISFTEWTLTFDADVAGMAAGCAAIYGIIQGTINYGREP